MKWEMANVIKTEKLKLKPKKRKKKENYNHIYIVSRRMRVELKY